MLDSSQKPSRHAFAVACDFLRGAGGHDSAAVLAPAVPFTAKITCKTLNVRSGPGTAYAISAEPVTLGEVFTIIDTSANGWGTLKSGAGWICLDYTQVV